MMLDKSLDSVGLNDEIQKIVELKGGAFFLDLDESNFFGAIFKRLNSRYQTKSEFCSRILYSEKPRPLHACFISSPDMNAFAYSAPDGSFDFIGINAGAVFTLLDLFGRLLSHPDVLIDVGDGTQENRERSYIPYLRTNIFDNSDSHEWTFPNCPVRARYCEHMLNSAIDFLFFHEVTHLRNGHCEWKRRINSKNNIEEAHGILNEIDGLISQTFEFDADCGATLYTLNQALDFMIFNSQNPLFLEDRFYNRAYGNRKLTARLVFISSYMLFRAFNFTDWDAANQLKFSHPQPPLRQNWIINTIFELFDARQSYQYPAEQFASDVAEFIHECENGVACVLKDELDARGIMSVMNSMLSNEHLALINTKWAEIRPELQEFKRGGRLAD